MATEARPPHVALLSIPGMGHLIPTAEFAKRLVLHHGLSTTVITYSDFQPIPDLHPSLTSITLPSIPLDDLPPEYRIETRLSILIARSAPLVKGVLSSLKTSTNLVAYVADIFGGDTLPGAKELGIPTYILLTSNFFTLSFFLHLPTLHDTTSCEFRDLPEPLRLPGCVPLRGADFLHTLQVRKGDAYPWMINMARRIREADGILVNSFEAIEPDTARILFENRRPPVYPVGPMTRSSDSDSGSTECMNWLDEQPKGSVLFVSFGSGGTLSCEQTEELAMGLESSGQRFLWVIRTPSDSKSNATFFGNTNTAEDPLDFLPTGFLSRMRGFVMRNWAPQTEVLGHVATGGFLSHCGWNSALESVGSGVPMIAWPLYAEQGMNAVMLEEGAKVAIRVKMEKGVVEREEICRVVKELMEGEGGKAARERMVEMKKAGDVALAEGGTSYRALAGVAKKWKDSSAT